MKRKEQIELLWMTHDFLLEKIYPLEEENEILYANIKEFQKEVNNPHKLLTAFLQINKDLDLFYGKQLICLDDIIPLHEENIDIPPEREIDIETLYALRCATINLLENHRVTGEEIKQLIDDLNERN